ncbi:hypothetical protein PHMEG_00023676 [Phytophthora megakarya]|uniref:SET domain-containing protein n=1 Tax=Phytophthora megakarya TaxID=4795 RepID=A0A225VI20_9STRA|nr:hypothetical protein PHMEG_00023676 [Phytophthora megakarya]
MSYACVDVDQVSSKTGNKLAVPPRTGNVAHQDALQRQYEGLTQFVSEVESEHRHRRTFLEYLRASVLMKAQARKTRRQGHSKPPSDMELASVQEHLKTIPTRLERSKIRHQPKKRAPSRHVPRSRKRRKQKKCAILRIPDVIDRLKALHIRRPNYGGLSIEASTEVSLVLSEVKWLDGIVYITECDVPEGISFPDIGDGNPCRCGGDCFMNSSRNATLTIYCTPECCGLSIVCSNAQRTRPELKLYDTSRVGNVVGEGAGLRCDYEAIVEGQPDQALKQNSGYTMLLNAKSTAGKYVYVEALRCGSVTRFLSNSCKPNVAFVEMQNRASVKVQAVMI